MAAKTLRNPYCLQMEEGEENQNMERKTKATEALVMAFLAYKNKHQQLEDLLQADFGHVPERFLLSVRTKSMTKNFVY